VRSVQEAKEQQGVAKARSATPDAAGASAALLGNRPRRLLLWLLAFAGALLVVFVSLIVTPESDALDDAPGDLALTMGGIETVRQTMVIGLPELAGVAIRIPDLGATTQPLSLTLRLRYTAGPPADLVRQTVRIAADDGVLTVRFPAIRLSRDPLTTTERLLLILDLPELPPNSGPSFVVRRNTQGNGGLVIDTAAIIDRDLAVAPIYERRWVDAIWPVSAMAAGKPGLLGWPPLYPLLAYLYLVALGCGVGALWRAEHGGD
jgi:hypothetical protein